jgi:hypothetical protein
MTNTAETPEVKPQVLSVTIRDHTFNFKDDYDMIGLEKLSTVEDKYEHREVNKMEVAYAGIVYLLESFVGPDGQELPLNYNQIREFIRTLNASEFTILGNTMASIKLKTEDKKKD